MNHIRIATRNSPLALWQANFVKDKLLQAHDALEVEIVGMTTEGDKLLDRSLAVAGGKGLFLKELEVSLLNNQTDIAVHSMKDVPVDLPQGLEIAAVCQRADARDAFVANNFQNLYALPKGASVGTSSLRRTAQLKKAFPALNFIELRGNVNTRLQKLDNGDYDAIILAAAGLVRLGFEDRIKQYISPELCLPAVGQGIVGVECRSDDAQTKTLLAALHSKESALSLAAERAMNGALDGGCQVPVAGYAQINNGKFFMRGLVGETNGSRVLHSQATSTEISLESAAKLGQSVANELLKQGAGAILDSVRNALPSQSAQLEKAIKPVVLLTRQHQYLGNTATILQRLEYHAEHIPTLKIEPYDVDELSAHFNRLADFTDLVFVSRNAVEIAMPVIESLGGVPDNVQVMSVGSETARQLFRYGVDAMFPEHGSGAEALLNVSQLEDLAGRNIMIVRGTLGLDWPAEKMRQRGAKVLEVNCYRQAVPAEMAKQLTTVLGKNNDIKGVLVHSSQSMKHLVDLAGEGSAKLLSATLVAGSQNIAMVAKERGWSGEIRVAESPSNKHMIIALSG